MAKMGKQKTIESRLRSDTTTVDRKINLSKSSNIFNENEGENSKKEGKPSSSRGTSNVDDRNNRQLK